MYAPTGLRRRLEDALSGQMEYAYFPVTLGDGDTAAGFAAGATDYVTKPFSPAHIRSRVHAWLLRRRAGAGGGPTLDERGATR